MALTLTTDLVFENQIALDHAFAYFNTKLGWINICPRFARELLDTPGNKVTIPYFTQIGEAEEPAEGVKFTADKLSDNEFQATVNLVGKAVAISDEATKRAGFTMERWFQEAIQQMEQRHAEKMQQKLIAELNLSTSHEAIDRAADLTFSTAFDAKKNINTSSALEQRTNVRALLEAAQEAFGDKRDQVMAYLLHSLQVVDVQIDKDAGYLRADANSPYAFLGGFGGTILGRPVFEFDTVPKGDKITFTDSNSATQKFQSYKGVIVKRDPAGLLVKQELELKETEAALARQKYLISQRYYAVKSFHKKISDDDKRVAMVEFLTKEQTT